MLLHARVAGQHYIVLFQNIPLPYYSHGRLATSCVKLYGLPSFTRSSLSTMLVDGLALMTEEDCPAN
jgi:hypothetical protein